MGQFLGAETDKFQEKQKKSILVEIGFLKSFLDQVTNLMGQFLSRETDRICQFLGTETDIMDETYYIIAIDYANVYAPAMTLSMPLAIP
jgi:hypothetical protein